MARGRLQLPGKIRRNDERGADLPAIHGIADGPHIVHLLRLPECFCVFQPDDDCAAGKCPALVQHHQRQVADGPGGGPCHEKQLRGTADQHKSRQPPVVAQMDELLHD
jgi:hypothetical protein